MQCNIDAKGKAVRLRIGLIAVALALVVLAITASVGAHSPWLWGIVGLLTAAGAFSIFEARAGWCAARAMGFQTRV